MYSTLDGDATTSNETKTPNVENAGATSPVLSNSKKSSLRLAKYRSRKKLLGKFASSQDSIASSSFTDSDSVAPLSPVLLESQVSEDNLNDINERFKRVRELQKQKKFHYDIAKSVSEYVDNQPDPAPSVNNNCDNNICVGFNMVSGKKVYVSDDLVRKYTKILNDVEIDENEITIKQEEDNISDCSTVILSTSPVRENNQTQITDTQILLATENAETMLEVVDNKWTPERTCNKENSQNFNISSINFDSQWGLSPTANREVPSQKEVVENIPKSTENQEVLSIPDLEHVDTQWFFSPAMKEMKEKSDTCSDITSPRCDTVSVLSSQDFTLHITEEEDSASNSSSSPKKLKISKIELKTFFGVLSFSTDGSTSLRQCTEAESNMQLRVKSDSWIFDVSFVNEDTLGFNSKYWKFYARKFHSYIESYERHIFPKKIVEIDKPIQKSYTKQRKTKNKNIKMPKKITQNRNYLKHNYNLRVSIDENTNFENETVFKVPQGVPIKTTPKSSNTQKDLQNGTSNVAEVEIVASPESSNKQKNKANVPNREVTAILEKMKKDNPLRCNIKLKDIQDLTAINKAIEKKKEDFLLKLKLETNNLVKEKLVELKQQAHLKYVRERDFINNVQKQDVIVAKTTSRKKSVVKTSVEKVRNDKSKSATETNITSEDLNISNFNSPIEGAASLNEEAFIENVDKILELIEDKSSKLPSTLQKSSVNEEKLMDLDLSSTIQNEFLTEFNTISDFSNDSGNLTLGSECTLTNIGYVKNHLEPISGQFEEKSKRALSKSNNDSEKNIIPQIVLIENTGFVFASGKKAAVKSTNIFNDIFENKPKSSISEKEKQLLEELKNIPEESIEELNKTVILLPAEKENQLPENFKDPKQSTSTFQNVPSTTKSNKEKQLAKQVKIVKDSAVKTLPQNKEKNNPGFSFASGKKPIIANTKSKNIFSDIFENKNIGAKSKKEKQLLEKLQNTTECSDLEILPLNELNPNTGLSFISEKNPVTKSTKTGNESTLLGSKKEEQFLTGLKDRTEDTAEELLPQVEINEDTDSQLDSGIKSTTEPINMLNERFSKEASSNSGILQDADNSGFSFVSGRKPIIKPTNVFNDMFENEANTSKSKKEQQFLEELENVSPVERDSGFSFLSGKKVAPKSSNIFKDIFDTEAKQAKSTKEKQLLDAVANEENDKPEENNNKNTTIPSYSSPVVGVKRPFHSPQIAANTSTPITKRPKLGASSRKRSLGSVAKTCRQLNLSEHSAKKAKLIFEDIDVPDLMNKSIITNTTSNPKHFTSTPIQEENPANTSLLNTSISMKETNETLVNSQKMKTSPIKTQPHQSFLEKHIPTLYTFQNSEIYGNKQKSLLEKKYELLNLEMSVIKTRIQMLEEQEVLIKNSNANYRKQRTGCLLCQKSKHSNRVALKELGRLQQNALNASKVDRCILEISPQNAINFRFFVPWWTNDNRTYPAIIPTEDGAILIPNDENYIGIHEIEQGFLAMPGIDPKLIPENWIRNHYKWIVWKFGSYERNFPNQFKGILMVENIVAQLKYRYDREIDLAQRPAIRRILEMDDSPAKRMVLCVSNIYKSQSLLNELELTDGWYSIKTAIDSSLNNLINTNKIFIGLKLMIHGAELLNCEGCHPLQTPANVRLKVHFNSTRRAAWHAKLGYQRNPGPLNVNLHAVRNLGGPVGFTTVYIARVYPVCFMEHGEKIIWRDKKAERKRANEWENNQKDSIEEYLEQTKKELNAERKEQLKSRKTQNRLLLSKNVSNINDPSLLYELWEECNDPESLTELLTEEQCNMLKNYQEQRNAEEQAELASRLTKKLNEKNIKNRNVSSVLKLLVVDVNSLFHYRILSIWRPTETHLQDLKEGECVDFYNLIVKDARNLSSTPRTRFTLNCDLNKTKFEKFERKVIPIKETINKQIFDEFDTIGMVVEISNEEDNKFMWIVDENKTYLLSHCDIFCIKFIVFLN